MAEEEKTIQFGDNNFAGFIDEQLVKTSRQGEQVKPICMKPYPRLIRTAKIKKEELDMESEEPYGKKPRGTVWREFPVSLIDWIRHDWLFIWCDFDGKDTIFTRKLDSLDKYTQQLERDKENLNDMILQKNEEMKGYMGQLIDGEKSRKELEDIRKGKEKEDEEKTEVGVKK